MSGHPSRNQKSPDVTLCVCPVTPSVLGAERVGSPSPHLVPPKNLFYCDTTPRPHESTILSVYTRVTVRSPSVQTDTKGNWWTDRRSR